MAPPPRRSRMEQLLIASACVRGALIAWGALQDAFLEVKYTGGGGVVGHRCGTCGAQVGQGVA